MSEEEESYCRLCAEPTPTGGLISADGDVGVNSKIATKMLWINIDISTANTLPNTICFSCFDKLERTWLFLHDVRSAQLKLNEIFCKKSDDDNSSSAIKTDETDPGKPVNEDWEEFQDMKKEVKPEIIDDDVQEVPFDPNKLIDIDLIKSERNSLDDNLEAEGYSTDSDVPLYVAFENKKKKKKKLKKKFISDVSLNAAIQDAESLTWDDYTCHCACCNAQCKNISSLRLHYQQIHSKCCTFKCTDCSKVMPNYKTFVRHVRSHRNLLRYCCEYCNKRYTLTSNLKKHRNKEHSDIYLTMCQSCGTIFESPELLQDHIILFMKSYRKRITKQEKLDDLKCEHCNKEFKSRSNLQTHRLVHTERNREFACHVCGKMFFTKGTLGTHMSTHEDKKPFKCEFCPMTFRARGNLKSHISLHSGSKPFVCEQCGKSFRVKRHLKSHSIVHTDLMPYECQYCKKTFRFKTRLNLHLRQHTGAKPYTCVYCQRDFTNGSNFKKHMRRRHNIDTSRKKYNNIVDEPVDQKVDIVDNSDTSN